MGRHMTLSFHFFLSSYRRETYENNIVIELNLAVAWRRTRESFNLTSPRVSTLFTPNLWTNTYSGSQVQQSGWFEALCIYIIFFFELEYQGWSRKAACRAASNGESQNSIRTAFSAEATETWVDVWVNMCRLERIRVLKLKKIYSAHKSFMLCCCTPAIPFDTHVTKLKYHRLRGEEIRK